MVGRPAESVVVAWGLVLFTCMDTESSFDARMALSIVGNLDCGSLALRRSL